MSLLDAFRALASVDERSDFTYNVALINGSRDYLVGKDANSAAVILVRQVAAAEPGAALAYRLEHLTVTPAVDCHLTLPGEEAEKGRFTVLRCDGDVELQTMFVRVGEALVASIEADPAAMGPAVARLVELFRALNRPAVKGVQGLWAELFVLAGGHDVPALAGAWHARSGDIFDFSDGRHRLEVKSCVGTRRLHRFSLPQLRPDTDVFVVIASVIVQSSAGGVSLRDMTDEIRARVSPDLSLIAKIDELVVATLGRDWEHGMDHRFDKELAEASLRYYLARAVPSIEPPAVPLEVSSVQFVTDLTEVPTLDMGDVIKLGSLFEALGAPDASGPMMQE